MGFAKVFTPLEGIAPLARVAQTLRGREFVVVAPAAHASDAQNLAPHALAYAFNDETERGMAWSLRCAMARIPAGRDIGILLADMPWVTRETLARVETLLGPAVDVAYPVDESDTPGHPVIFSARCRARLESLPEGDTLRIARDDPSLRRASAVLGDRGAFIDLDTPSDWHAPRRA
jgi:CTP:molybdopterin cytidylyltransferase MocA